MSKRPGSWSILLLCLGLTIACDEDNKNDCIDLSSVRSTACYDIYLPVCGCNGKTYGNDCYAQSAGVVRWTEGPCSKR